jgi:TonB-linked SusC/RagA family outer membrane protein
MFLCCLFTLLQAGGAWAQATGRVTGRVTDAAGQPLAGASVAVVGTSLVTPSGQDGSFTLTGVPAGAHTVKATLLGYTEQTREVSVVAGQAASVDFQLATQAVQLEGLVAVGYGTVERRNLTGSVAQVSAQDLEDRPVARVEDALAGQMAGVQVRQTTGQPGEPLEVRVRGSASISAGNDPLYVVDGVPVEDLGNVNPQDIASIEVLKDAASAAIYGSRGANGVVLVTTKNGRVGAPRFTFSTTQGVSTLAKKLDLLSPTEWMAMKEQAMNDAWVALGQRTGKDYKATDPIAFRQSELGVERNGNYIPDPRWASGCEAVACIDWQDEFYRPAYFSNYELSGSGGTDNVRYRISGAYLNQDGIAVYTGFRRANLQANLDAQLTPRLHMGLNLQPSVSWGTGGNVNGKDAEAHHLVSMAPVADPEAGVMTAVVPNDRYYYAGSTVSPVGVQEFTTNDTQDRRLFSKLYLDADLFSGLKGNVTGAWNSDSWLNTFYSPSKVNKGLGLPPGSRSSGRYRTTNYDQYLLQGTLNYDKLLGEHSINAVIGGSTEYYQRRGSDQRDANFSNDLLQVIDNQTSQVTTSATNVLERSLVSVFGRMIYSYSGKYLATASLRRDGSSKFGADNKWGLFPAFSLGWVASEEPFLSDVGWLSNLKLRASWGVTGNNQIPDYVYFGSMDVFNTSFGDALAVGYGPSSLSNPDLGWEQTRSIDAGVDLGLFDQRIAFTADYYNKLTNNLLLRVPVARATGFSTGWANIGKVRNEGLELELSGQAGTADFTWNPSANIAFNRNRVVQLGPGNAPIYNGYSGHTQIIQVGQPLNEFYLYDAIGVLRDSADVANSPILQGEIMGDVKYRDVNNDGVIDDNDRTLMGHRDPTYTWGLTNSFTFHALDLSVLLQGQGGNMVYGILGRAIDRPGMGTSSNAMGRWRDRWISPEQPGDGHTPRIDGTTGGVYDSRWLYDATYLSLRNVTLGYTLPAGLRHGLGTTRIYLSGDNLLMRDDYYGGYTPEADNNDGGDYGGYPTARTITIGLTTSF